MKLEEHPFFAELRSKNASDLIALTEVTLFDKGDIIFDEGSSSDGLYLLLEGKVAFIKAIPGNKHRIISYAEEGGFFGEIGIFTGANRSLGATAQVPVTIARIPREALVDFIRNTPGPIEQILQNIVNHLHHTTRHYVEDMLQQEKLAVVGNMMNSIIHDFKNPFTMISIAAQLLKSMHADERSQRLCHNIETQIDRMVEMAAEIAEFSKGEQAIRISKVNLALLLERFRILNEPYFKKDNITIAIKADDVIVEAEENKLLRVFQNLITNAIEAMHDHPAGTIAIDVFAEDSAAVITIADNGPGIPEDIKHNLFDPFITFGKSRGTGLGTAIVKSIINNHHGTIDFESEASKGTCFTITLPLVQPH